MYGTPILLQLMFLKHKRCEGLYSVIAFIACIEYMRSVEKAQTEETEVPLTSLPLFFFFDCVILGKLAP